MKYEKRFKEEAVKLSDEMGIKKASAQLGVPYYTISEWRQQRSRNGKVGYSSNKYKGMTEEEKDQRIRELERANSELEKANDILKDALGFFAKDRKK